MTEAFKTALEDIQEQRESLLTYKEEMLNSLASEFGMSATEFQEYADTLREIEGNATECDEALYNLAAINLRASKAFENLQSNSKKWKTTLETMPKTSDEYRGAMTSMRTTLANLYNVEKKFVSADFVTEHLEDIQKAAEGSEKAAKDLGKALADNILGKTKNMTLNVDVNADGAVNALDTVGSMFSDLIDNYSDTPIGVTINPESAIAGLNEIVQAGGETAEQVMAALNAIGWTPEIEMETVPITDEDRANGYVRVPKVKFVKGVPVIEGFDEVPITGAMAESGQVQIPKIGPGGKPVIKGLTRTGTGGSGGAVHKPSGGGGGGGGGGEPSTKDKKDLWDIERYHQINQEIERQQKLLERNNKLKNRAYGAGYLNMLKKENQELTKQNKLNADKWKEAEDYMRQDRAELEANGATFDGDILNYQAYMEKLYNEYNAEVAKWNAMSADEQDNNKDAWDDFEDEWQHKVDLVEKYEEALQIAEDMQNQILENQNKISANNLEGLKYKVSLRLDLNSADVKLLQYFQEKWADDLEKSAESV